MARLKSNDLRSPLARSRDEWFESDEGVLVLSGRASGDYLKNRLERAFVAGWNAHRREQESAAPRSGH